MLNDVKTKNVAIVIIVAFEMTNKGSCGLWILKR